MGEVSSDTVHTYYVWIVDEVLNNVKFIKKIIQVKGISDEYGPSTEDTHFSEEL